MERAEVYEHPAEPRQGEFDEGPMGGQAQPPITRLRSASERTGFWPSLAVAHEIGHFVDHAGLPGTGYRSVVRTMPEDSSHREGARRCRRRVLDASAGAVSRGLMPST